MRSINNRGSEQNKQGHEKLFVLAIFFTSVNSSIHFYLITIISRELCRYVDLMCRLGTGIL